MPLVFTHGRTSEALLNVNWEFPVYVPPAGAADQTRAVAALSREDALKAIAGDDRRPLLILRECFKCAGSDTALLSQTLRNERTVLLTHWFHCVKLPVQVAEANHPFAAIFEDGTHVFLCSADGSKRVDFSGEQSQTQLWKAMTGLLRDSYEGDPEASVKEMLSLLTQFDRIDDQEGRLLVAIDNELETKGARSAKLERLQAELRDLGEKKADLVARQKKLAGLPLKTPAEPVPADAPGGAR